MLVLTRKQDESVVIFKDGGDHKDAVEVFFLGMTHGKAKLGFRAGNHMVIIRKELVAQGGNDGQVSS